MMWWVAFVLAVLHWCGAGYCGSVPGNDAKSVATFQLVGAVCVVALAILAR